MTLTDFLLARIAEDEGINRRIVKAAGFAMFNGEPVDPHARRLLAECEAKRRIVELSWHHLGDEEYGWGMEEAKRQILTLLALPYADHPDYREEWRP
jgi:hypothetical protein